MGVLAVELAEVAERYTSTVQRGAPRDRATEMLSSPRVTAALNGRRAIIDDGAEIDRGTLIVNAGDPVESRLRDASPVTIGAGGGASADGGDQQGSVLTEVWPLLAAAALGVLATRLLFGEGMTGLGMLLLEVLIPLVIFTGALILGAWIASACRHGSHAVWRFVLPCGLLAFFLHCMVEDNLSFPAPALAFWIIAGACLSGAAARSAGGSRLAKPRAAILVVAVVALVVCVWRPVFVRTRWADKAPLATPAETTTAAERGEQDGAASRLPAPEGFDATLSLTDR